MYWGNLLEYIYISIIKCILNVLSNALVFFSFRRSTKKGGGGNTRGKEHREKNTSIFFNNNTSTSTTTIENYYIIIVVENYMFTCVDVMVLHKLYSGTPTFKPLCVYLFRVFVHLALIFFRSLVFVATAGRRGASRGTFFPTVV